MGQLDTSAKRARFLTDEQKTFYANASWVLFFVAVFCGVDIVGNVYDIAMDVPMPPNTPNAGDAPRVIGIVFHAVAAAVAFHSSINQARAKTHGDVEDTFALGMGLPFVFHAISALVGGSFIGNHLGYSEIFNTVLAP